LWTGKRLTQIARELAQVHIAVSPHTVRRLLDQLGYSSHSNSKSLSVAHPERDQQFQCVARQRKRFARRSQPIISVDTKKKELVGNFNNNGRVWRMEPTPVKDHDFRSEALGMANPDGILDLLTNPGAVFVGTSHDTPEFAAGNVARWWRDLGRRTYSDAFELLILADSGGSNGARCALGNTPCKNKSSIGSIWRSPFVIIQRAPQSGIRLSAGFLARSANTGPGSLWTVTKPFCAWSEKQKPSPAWP
jgi:hypothetical protein